MVMGTDICLHRVSSPSELFRLDAVVVDVVDRQERAVDVVDADAADPARHDLDDRGANAGAKKRMREQCHEARCAAMASRGRVGHMGGTVAPATRHEVFAAAMCRLDNDDVGEADIAVQTSLFGSRQNDVAVE